MNHIPEIPGLAQGEVPLCQQSWWIKYRDRLVLGTIVTVALVVAGLTLWVAWTLRYFLLAVAVAVGVLCSRERRTVQLWVEAAGWAILAFVLLPVLEFMLTGVLGFIVCCTCAWAIVFGAQVRAGAKR